MKLKLVLEADFGPLVLCAVEAKDTMECLDYMRDRIVCPTHVTLNVAPGALGQHAALINTLDALVGGIKR